MASSTVTPFAKSVLKFQIFRNNRPIWNASGARNSIVNIRRRRHARIHPCMLPHRLHLRPRSLQVGHRGSLYHPPLLRLPSPPMSSLADSNPANAKTVRVVVKGRVQGVFYRDWTVENAKELVLKGWVRNRRDGSVEALFSGNPDKVKEMEQRCRRGPPAAVVTGIEVLPCDDDPGTGFQRRSTV